MRTNVLSLGIAGVVVTLIGVLAVAQFTGFDGYSYSYCDTFSFVRTAQAHGVDMQSPDQKRLHDLYELRDGVEAYKERTGVYPVYPSVTAVGDMPQLYDAHASDPCASRNTAYGYQYISNEDGTQFVLRALLSDSGYRYVHVQYTDSLEGEHLGVWCGEGRYRRIFCLGEI